MIAPNIYVIQYFSFLPNQNMLAATGIDWESLVENGQTEKQWLPGAGLLSTDSVKRCLQGAGLEQ